MSIIVTTLIQDGIVIATDSRQVSISTGGQLRTTTDYAQKLFQINSHQAVAVCGLGDIYLNDVEAPMSIKRLIHQISSTLSNDCSVYDLAYSLHSSLTKYINVHKNITNSQWNNMQIIVAGFDKGNDIGKLFRCMIPGDLSLERETKDPGIFWSGFNSIIDRIILGFDPKLLDQLLSSGNFCASNDIDISFLGKYQLLIDFSSLTLQDALSLTSLLVQSTIQLCNLTNGLVGFPGQFPLCGGAIDIATITSEDGFRWIKKKQIESPI